MPLKKEFVVSIDVTEQVSEDSWMVRTRTLKVTAETTIEQIEEWYRTHRKAGLTYFLLTELETNPPCQ